MEESNWVERPSGYLFHAAHFSLPFLAFAYTISFIDIKI